MNDVIAICALAIWLVGSSMTLGFLLDGMRRVSSNYRWPTLLLAGLLCWAFATLWPITLPAWWVTREVRFRRGDGQ